MAPKYNYFSVMKAAACGTWVGGIITALIVTDMMLQVYNIKGGGKKP